MDADVNACLLLGLSSGTHADSQPSVNVDPSGASPSALSPRCTPAVVATALMSANKKYDATTAADSTKNRRMQVSALPRKEWSAEEDALIRSGVEKLGCRWRVIAAQLPGRSDDAVRNRWSRLQESLRGGSAQSRRASASSGIADMEILHRNSSRSNATRLSGIPRFGTAGGSSGSSSIGDDEGAANGGDRVNGSEAPAVAVKGAAAWDNIGGRSGSGNSGCTGSCSCGGSWGCTGRGGSSEVGAGGNGGNMTGSSSKLGEPRGHERTSWTRAEDDVIIQGIAELGHKWYEIARRLPGRTDHAIRNRWSRLQSIIGMESIGGAESSAKLRSPRQVPMIVGFDSPAVVPPAMARTADMPRISLAVTLPPPPPPSQPAAASLQVLLHTATESPAAAAAALAASNLLYHSSQAAATSPAASHEATTTMHASLSLAVLANVGGLRRSDGSGINPEGSDAEFTTGTSELLLLHRTPLCHSSPQISSTARSIEEWPDLLLLNYKRSRV